MYNDFYCSGEVGVVQISFTNCNDDQFTCDSGLCVDISDRYISGYNAPIQYRQILFASKDMVLNNITPYSFDDRGEYSYMFRCNSDPGCHDLSDEFDCQIINPGKSYQSFIAPPPNNLTGLMEKKVEIDISADIVAILDIDEIASIFQVQFFLHFSWYDPRLIFFNLKEDSGLNALSPEEKQQIWVPALVFSNTENRLSTLVDEDSTVTIERRGTYTVPDITELENRHFFSGSGNQITLTRFYNIRFLCYYNMNWYPFDLQTCSLILQMKVCRL